MITGALAVVVLLGAAGLALIVVNGRKLISDWPRSKPRHNVDLAWIQLYLGLAALVVAWIVATDPARKLIEPTPFVAPAASAENQAASPGR